MLLHLTDWRLEPPVAVAVVVFVGLANNLRYSCLPDGNCLEKP